MKLIHYTEQEGKAYPGDLARGAVGRVVIGQADGNPSFCLRVFEVEPDGFSAKHSHDYEHQVFVHAGEGEAWNGETWQKIGPGSILYIPANEEHQLKNVGKKMLVFACAIPKGAPEL